jgi:hypothetical protein
MLFAILDYLQYRSRTGRYSARQLAAAGGFLADESSLDRLKGVRDGDIVGCHPTNWFVGWLVMYVIDYPFSHVGVLTREGTVVEATLSGTIERPAAAYFDGNHYLRIVRMQGLDDDKEKKVVAAMRKKIGGGYDLGAAIAKGLRALSGGTLHYSFKHGVDVLLTLAGLALLIRRFPVFGFWGIVALAIGYVVLVIVNRVALRRASRLSGLNE